jgi:hypothetical protein
MQPAESIHPATITPNARTLVEAWMRRFQDWRCQSVEIGNGAVLEKAA